MSDPGPADPLAAADLRGWARRLAGVLRRSGRPLLVLQLACLLPAGLLATALAGLGAPGAVAAGVLVAAATAYAQAASVWLAIREAAGSPTAVSAALAAARGSGPALLGWSALAALLTVLGLALAVLPGLYVAAVAAAALPGTVVVERAGLVRAARLVTRRPLGTLARCALGLFAVAFYGAVVGSAVAALPAPADDVLRALAAVPFTLAAAAFATVTYAGLRQAEDGATTAHLAESL